MALPATKKDLIYSSFEEFRQKTSFDFSKLDFNRPSICNSLLKLYDQGTSCLSLGDDEKAYMLLFRFFEGYLKLKSSKLYKQDKNYVDNFISKEKLNQTMSILETLNEEIKQRYQEQNENKYQIITNEINICENMSESMTENLAETTAISNCINPTEFTNLIRQNLYKILLIDIRNESEYQQSRINLDYLITSDGKEKNLISHINISDELIDTTCWNISDALAKKDQKASEIFSQRFNYDYLILFDSNSFYKDLKSDSKLMILKRALYDYDLKKIKNEPVVLDGGWSQWLLYYPACKTVSIQASISVPIVEEKKIDIDYPEVAEITEQNEVLSETDERPQEPELAIKPLVDRTNKPKEKENTEFGQETMPVILPILNQIQKPKLVNNENNLVKIESKTNSTLENFLPTNVINRINKPQFNKIDGKSDSINETIFNSVYAPARFKYVHTPFMKEGDNKVLNPVTGTFSYANKLEGLNQETKNSNIKTIHRENKPNLKRTFSSPNVADLDLDNIVNENNDSSKLRTLPKPVVNRANKPMQEDMMVLRLEDLEPVYAKVYPGLTGIRNLGNTCFMSSIIQCLSNTELFVKFFLSDQFKKDINRQNVLGFKGEIADEFAVIMKALWTGRCKVISPHRFKYLIEEFNQLFVSNEQQDAQEFLLFLLDGLHEDLNRVRIRPKFSVQENDNSESISADKAWKDHLSNNNSIIIDLFQVFYFYFKYHHQS